MRRNVADRVKAIIRELDISVDSSDERNKETLYKFLADHGYQGIKNYPIMKNFYERFKTKYKNSDDDDDSKLNQLLRDQHSNVQDPTLGWLMK